MSFNSLSYFLFLPVVFILHSFASDRFRWLILLVASFFFYAALKVPHLIAVLLIITTITYFLGQWIDREDGSRAKLYLLWTGISANVLTLIILKYLPFITQNLNNALNLISPGTAVPVSKGIIAIGTSYFIFQAISYLIDIYLGVEKPERHFGHFALYMSFFPKLLQGPIERSGELLPQFKIPYVFDYDNVRAGMLLFAIGLLKKVAIADSLGLMVNPVFNNVHAYKGFPLLLASYYYSLQIYFDFSGYTDMALGTAMMFNVTLTQNFKNPYFATSIADFWRRWHISFSRWILDYIFKPLQMSWRSWGDWGAALALLVTFTISGVWHGSSWGFVAWGILHGLYMAFSIPYKSIRRKTLKYLNVNTKSFMLKLIEMFLTFQLVSIGWIFFRANSLSDALYVITNSFSGGAIRTVYESTINDILTGKLNLSFDRGFYPLLLLYILIIFITLLENLELFRSFQTKYNIVARWAIYTPLIFAFILHLMLLGPSMSPHKQQFIYNQF